MILAQISGNISGLLLLLAEVIVPCLGVIFIRVTISYCGISAAVAVIIRDFHARVVDIWSTNTGRGQDHPRITLAVG